MLNLTENLAMFLAEDSYEGWMKILSTNPDILNILCRLEKESPNSDELKEIIREVRYGARNKLSIKEIELYANFKFNQEQRRVIITALAKGISFGKVRLIASLGLTSDRQITELIRGCEQGLLVSDIKRYDWTKFSTEQISLIVSGLLKFSDKTKVEVYAKPEYTSQRMMVIYENLEDGEYTDKQIKLCTSESLIDAQVDALFWAVRFCGTTEAQLETFAKPEFNKNDIRIISQAYANGWSKRKMAFLLKPLLNTQQRKEVYDGLAAGMKLKHVKLYAKEQIPHEKMKIMKIAIQNGYSETFIQELNEATLNGCQMCEIEKALVGNISEDYIKVYMREPWDGLQIRSIYEGIILYKLPIETINIYANKSHTGYEMSLILKALTSGKISTKTVKRYVDMGFYSHQLKYIFEACENKAWWQKFKPYASKEFTADHMREILNGIKKGLTKEQIALCAKPNFSAKDMSVIYGALQRSIDIQTVELVVNTGMHWKDMEELFDIIVKFNVQYDQARLFIKPVFSTEQYYRIFEGLFNDFTIEEVNSYAKPEISSKDMLNTMEQISKEKRVNNLIWLTKMLATEK